MHHNFLFDLDQTLLDFHASERKALEIVITSNGLEFTEDCYDHFKKYNKSLWLELEKGTISRTELFIRRFTDLFEFCGGDHSGLDPLKVNKEFIFTMSQNGVLMDGALEFIIKLKNNIRDARCYIVSNGATINAEGRIKSTGLFKYLEKVYVSEWMGVTKPSPEFFDMVLEGVAEPKETCIVIGDSLSSDMLGAKNASLASVWFMPEGDIEAAKKAYDIDYCASSFDELFEVLAAWASSDHADLP
jgi:YjjG family noncanonical pyrimidine nucleotidase